jgi:hypothetical protein
MKKKTHNNNAIVIGIILLSVLLKKLAETDAKEN